MCSQSQINSFFFTYFAYLLHFYHPCAPISLGVWSFVLSGSLDFPLWWSWFLLQRNSSPWPALKHRKHIKMMFYVQNDQNRNCSCNISCFQSRKHVHTALDTHNDLLKTHSHNPVFYCKRCSQRSFEYVYAKVCIQSYTVLPNCPRAVWQEVSIAAVQVVSFTVRCRGHTFTTGWFVWFHLAIFINES